MQKEALLQGIKFWGTALIIAAAAVIMMPGLLGYLMGLSRIMIIVVMTLIIATVVGNIIFRLRRPVQSVGKTKTGDNSASDLSDSSETDEGSASSAASKADVTSQD